MMVSAASIACLYALKRLCLLKCVVHRFNSTENHPHKLLNCIQQMYECNCYMNLPFQIHDDVEEEPLDVEEEPLDAEDQLLDDEIIQPRRVGSRKRKRRWRQKIDRLYMQYMQAEPWD